MGEGVLKCAKCGTVNLPDAERCRMCGNMFPAARKLPDDRVRCPHCQAENYIQDRECTVCQRRLVPERAAGERKATVIPTNEWEKMRGYEDRPHQARRLAWVSIGGMLVLLAGMFGVVDGVLVIGLGMELNLLDVDSVTCSALMLVFGVVAIMGGIMAIMRMQFPVAVLGAVFGILAYGCVLGSILSLIGLIMIVLSRREFAR